MASSHVFSLCIELIFAYPLPFWLVTIVSGLLLHNYSKKSVDSHFPVINDYPNDFFRRKAYAAYRENATQLVEDGLKRFNGPFRILTPSGSKVVLPSEYHDWVKGSSAVSHQEFVYEEFHAYIPGFDAQRIISDPSSTMIHLTKIHLSSTPALLPIMNSALSKALHDRWTDTSGWHALDWMPDTMGLISAMSAAVFVGPRLGTTEVWQTATLGYVNGFFVAVLGMWGYPKALAGIVARLGSGVKICKRTLSDMRVLIEKELQTRAEEEGKGVERVRDALDWVAEHEASKGREADLAGFQAAFAVAALHTTSEMLRKVLTDLCAHSELVEPLRAEIKGVLNEQGLTMAGLANLRLLDSVLKESQRFGTACVGLERRVTQDTKLPNGTVLRRGTDLGVSALDIFNPSIHGNPLEFDGYRFLRLREQDSSIPGPTGTMAQFVSSTKEHNTFGAGKFICPGRFFAANEVKLALVHILMTYDVMLKEGTQAPQGRWFGYLFASDWGAQVEVRRRPNTVDLSYKT